MLPPVQGRTTLLLLAHYAAVAVAALAGLVSNTMAPAVFFLPIALVPVEEALLWKHGHSKAERTDAFVFGACGLTLCAALAIGGIGLTLAAWLLGGVSLIAWTVYGLWRASQFGGF